ncbi:MAG: hypothetical protein RLZZ450_4695 [Pseudomonadota bacterium]|jgi:hypothetical protein
MTRHGLFGQLAKNRQNRPVFATFVTLALAACGGDKGVEQTRDPVDESDDTPKKDAGRRADAGSKDAGKQGSSGSNKPGTTNPVGGDKDDPGPAPKELERVDECGANNSAGLKPADIDKLKAGGKADGLKLLYPYDGTIFPRGLGAPKVMWQGAAGSAVYLRIRSKFFEYDGCLKPTGNGQLDLSQAAWDKAGAQTMGPSTPFDIELSVLDSGTVRGPLKQSIVIAQATLKGSIYYGSYNSRIGAAGGLGLPGGGAPAGGGGLPGGLGGLGGGGSILRIKPGKPAEFFARSGTCTGCHTVSANGERMIAKEFASVNDGSTYALKPDTAPNPQPSRAAVSSAFTGLSPDGSVYINNAVQNGIGPNIMGGPGGGLVPATATLRETDTGTEITGSGIPPSASMGTFSPDGTMIAMNDLAQASGGGISLMDYDAKARKASNPRLLFQGGQGLSGWPFLLPDNGAVIFTTTDARDFSGGGVGINGLAAGGPRSDLMIVDALTGKATLLARAMGFATPEDAAANKTYLPFGAEELHQHYYPTVSPIAAGGYFWVFFDSVRHYGNLGIHRQLWGAAVAIQHDQGEFHSDDGLYALDPSAPAFYLPGQELETANHRAFTALDPCRADGASCESGVDCCSGFCTDGVCGPPTGCSETNEACKQDSDCCNPNDRCIAGFCGQILL